MTSRGRGAVGRRWSTRLPLLLALIALAGCAAAGPGRREISARSPAASADVVTLTILHINDVYEMTPLVGGAQGGLARVAALRRALLRQNPNTITVLAGDLFNPSVMGAARVDGEPLSGRQMVDVMNAVGLDYATFGNHEFDLPHAEFLKRLSESKTRWFSSNVRDAEGRSFPGIPAHVTFTVRNPGGAAARVGLFGLTIAANRAAYVSYVDALEAARRQVGELRPQVDILVAVTHLMLEDDVRLVEALPEIDLVIGGHEHEDVLMLRGMRLTPIAKADANARTVYVHDLAFNAATRALDVESRVRKITADVSEDPEVAARVQRWVDEGFAGLRREGFEPTRVVARTTAPLDGRETSVRNGSTRLTELLARALLASVPGASWSIYNSGAIRIDDVIAPGPMTEYDVMRILPFGGGVVSVVMTGAVLQRVLEQGRANKGRGGYLQTAHVEPEPVDVNGTYTVAIADFLLTGQERGLGFLKDNPDVRENPDAPRIDMRRALIAELERSAPAETGR